MSSLAYSLLNTVCQKVSRAGAGQSMRWDGGSHDRYAVGQRGYKDPAQTTEQYRKAALQGNSQGQARWVGHISPALVFRKTSLGTYVARQGGRG